jgi:hypothetical protein
LNLFGAIGQKPHVLTNGKFELTGSEHSRNGSLISTTKKSKSNPRGAGRHIQTDSERSRADRMGVSQGTVQKHDRTVELGEKYPYRSLGLSPVCFAIRASIAGPMSSPSWKAKV